jgi:guanylate kinase
MHNGKLFILSAPTGGGKTTVATNVLHIVGTTHPFSRVITYTTRLQRPGEQNGIDYHFVTETDFLKKKAENFFLETNQYDNKWYGSPRSIIEDLKQGKSFLAITDRNGARAWKRNIPEAVLIWLDVPNVAIIAQRLHKRGDSEAVIKRRTAIAAQEIAEEKQEHFFDHHVMNEDLQKAIEDVVKIVIEHTCSSPCRT